VVSNRIKGLVSLSIGLAIVSAVVGYHTVLVFLGVTIVGIAVVWLCAYGLYHIVEG
jgi:hypothetical protein